MLKCDVSTSTISKLGKNDPVSMESMTKICKVLDCNIGDIVDIIDEDTQDKGGYR